MSLGSEGWGKLLPADVDMVSLVYILLLGLFLYEPPVNSHLLIEYMPRSKFPVYWYAPLCNFLSLSVVQ